MTNDEKRVKALEMAVELAKAQNCFNAVEQVAAYAVVFEAFLTRPDAAPPDPFSQATTAASQIP